VPRALVIGAETGGLRGANNDANDVTAWLTGWGFAVDLRIGSAATRDAILDGLHALIADVRADDATVVYYSGHGGMLEVTDPQPSRLGYLVPTDHEPGARFRGITELEWSCLVAALTARTRNVAVIHDCCHAAQTVRGGQPSRGTVRALAPIRVGPSDARAMVEASGSALLYPLGNPDAVRLTAASGHGLAWEHPSASGRVQGVFTNILLAEVGVLHDRTVSWAELGGRVRDRVLRATGRQRPEIEGPITRRVFGLDVIDAAPRISVRPEGRRFVLAAGRVHGVERGDVFWSANSTRQTAVVTQVGLFESIVRVDLMPGEARTFEAVAGLRATKYPIALELDDEHMRSAFAGAIERTPRLCVGDATDAMVRVRLEHGQLMVSDQCGSMRPLAMADAHDPSRAVVQLARLASIRVLQRIAKQLDEPGQLTMAVDRVGAAPDRLVDGAPIGPADRLCVHVANNTQRTLWLHVFAVGPGLAVEALGPVSSGTQIDPRSTEVLGAMPGLGSVGFTLRYSADALGDGPYPIELIAIATTTPVDLTSVVAPDVSHRIAPVLGASSAALPSEASRDVRPSPGEHRATSTRRCFLFRP